MSWVKTGKKRGGQFKTHCLRGHERTPENLCSNGSCKICVSIRSKEYRSKYNNNDFVSERERGHYQKNRDKRLATNREYRLKNIDKFREKEKKAYLSRDKEARRVWQGKYRRRNTDSLSDAYVASTLGLKVKEVPPEILEIKRITLQLHRSLRNGGNTSRHIEHDGESKNCTG